VFNVLGPLLNPVSPTHRLLGVSDKTLAITVAHGLAHGCFGLIDRAWVVTGPKGEDELGLHPDLPNHIWEVSQGKVQPLSVYQSSSLVFPPPSFSPNLAVTLTIPPSNKDLFLALLRGENIDSSVYHQVCLNAAAGLCIAGYCDTISTGLQEAKTILASGVLVEQLQRLQHSQAMAN
jgi:anthranilate phosphoribosyltransferase